MSEQLVRVTKIQKFCTHDGPGIRTTVFFKGCPLRCAWCHNPETRSPRPGLMFSENLCVHCGICAQICENGVHTMGETRSLDRENCLSCGSCARACPTGALEMDSSLMSVPEIMAEVLRDRAFYGAAGGLTVSGGEPMFQPEACIALLRAAKEAGISTAVETCGYFDPAYIDELARVTDIFLWDYKDSDPGRHRKYTGCSNELILANLRRLNACGADICLRCIMVEGVNMTPEHAAAIAADFHALENCRDVELLPYHAYGASKAAQTGVKQEGRREWIPSDARLDGFRQMLSANGVILRQK